MSNKISQIELFNKINYLSEIKGQTQSSMISLAIPPKYCI